jgi:Glycosyltransferase family 87
LLHAPKFGLLLAIVMAGCMCFYLQDVLIRYQQADAAAHLRPRGNLSDLYPRWLGARELILHHRDPYSAEITREIQAGYYGRPLDPERPGDPRDQQRFAYPIYVVFLLAPFIGLPFPLVQEGFYWILGLVVASTVLLWLRAIRWRPRPAVIGIQIILTLGSYPVLQGLKLQQLSLLVSGLIAASLLLLAEGQLVGAGALLAAATIKPQLVLPLIAWLALWAFSQWRSRRRLLWSFAGVMTLLLIGGEWILPGWTREFRQALTAYRQYAGGFGSILTVLTNASWSLVLTAIILLGLGALGWRLRNQPADAPLFAFATALVLATTLVVIPMTSPYNQVLLLPAVLLLVRNRRCLFSGHRLMRMAAILASVIFLWPYLLAVVLALASLLLPAATIQKAWDLPLRACLALPPVVSVLLAWLTIREVRSRGDSLQWHAPPVREI